MIWSWREDLGSITCQEGSGWDGGRYGVATTQRGSIYRNSPLSVQENTHLETLTNPSTNTIPRQPSSLTPCVPTSITSTTRPTRISKQKYEWSRTIKHLSQDQGNTTVICRLWILRIRHFHISSLGLQSRGFKRATQFLWALEFTNLPRNFKIGDLRTRWFRASMLLVSGIYRFLIYTRIRCQGLVLTHRISS